MLMHSYLATILSPTVIIPDVKKRNLTVDSTEELVHKLINVRWKNFIKIYTDGSKTADKTSAAFWLPDYDLEGTFPLNPISSIFHAESKAILEAIRMIGAMNTPGKYLIMSDSKSVLTALAHRPNSKTNPIIMQTKQLVLDLRTKKSLIHLLWIHSHMGIAGNEFADSLAREAPGSYEDKELPILAEEILGSLQRDKISTWQHKWDNSPKGRQFHILHPTVNVKPWFHNMGLVRSIITTTSRIRFGHVVTNEHLYKINIKSSPYCDCGPSVDSVDHRIFDCGHISTGEKTKLKQELTRLSPDYTNCMNLLRANNLDAIKILNKYISNNNIIL